MRDLLLISDLHLGSHLKPRTRGEYVHLAARIEENFPRFLDHYRAQGQWQLVINGDFIDFWNVEGGEGGSPEQVAVNRLHMVFDEYPAVEDALVRFLEAGHGIVFVAGNHDAEFLYPEVRRALVQRLEGATRHDASITRTGMTRIEDLGGARVRVVEWFLREEGGAWIEHGHLFDSACRTDNQLSPTRRGRLVKTVAEVATRSFTNLMPEMDYDAPDKFTTADYLRWMAARGFRFAMRCMLLYLRMVGRMIALWRTGRVDRKGKAEHEGRLAKIAANAGLQMSALTALQTMAPPPSSATIGGVLSVTHMDFFLSGLLPLLIVPWLAVKAGLPLWGAAVLGLAATALTIRGVARRRSPRNVHQDMCDVAADVGRLVDAPLVLMGHSHHGGLDARGGVIYGNSGSWLDGSHLVVMRDRRTARLSSIELRRWRNGGVQVLDQSAVPERPSQVRDTAPTPATSAAE